MKLYSAVLAAVMATSVQAGESGLRERELAAPAQVRRFPAGFFPAALPTEPVEACVSDLPMPYTDTEYIVMQYGDALNSTCLDLEDVDTQSSLATAFLTAYLDVSSACTQEGAFCDADSAEFAAQDTDSSSFLIKTMTTCNAGTFLNEDEICGIDLLEGDVPVGLDRRLEETCSCARPSAADVLSKFNAIVASEVSSCPEVVAAWAIAIEQFCVLECVGDEYSYSAAGVVPPCEESEYPSEYPSDYPSDYPSEYPSEFPTETVSPEPSETPTGSPEPTDAPSASPTDAPTESPTDAPTTSTASPTASTPEPTAPVATLAPTSEASADPV